MTPQNFVNISGIDQNEGASVVFVWRRHKGAGMHALLGTGHVVKGAPDSRPPGVLAGQFCVTLPLPTGCSVDDVFVTDDMRGQERLRGIRVSACGTRLGLLPQEATTGPVGRPDGSLALSVVSENGGISHV